jgi:hypothetical protein
LERLTRPTVGRPKIGSGMRRTCMIVDAYGCAFGV